MIFIVNFVVNKMRTRIYRIALSGLLALIFSFSLGAQIRKSEENRYFVSAVTLYSFGQYKDALGLFDGLIDVNPLDDASYYYGGLCHYSMRNLQKALTYFEKAHSLDPNNYYYSQILASVYSVGLNTKDKSIVRLEDRAVNYPKRTDSYFLLYTLYAEKGEIDKALAAVKHIEEAYGENPNTIRIRFNLLKSVGREEEGYALLREYYAGAEEGQI